MRARRPFVVAALVLVVSLVGAGTATAAPAPRDFYGLEAKDIYVYSSAYRDAEFPKVKAAGVGLMRQELVWAATETAPGKYDFARYDTFVRDAAKRGIEVMPVLITTPDFRKPAPGGSEMTPPKNYGDLGDFAAVVSRRYGPNGSYWSANPSIPRVPVRRFQIWNEPNIPRFWPTGVNPAQYAAMLKAVYPKIKAADPGAEVVTAGISEPQNPCCMALRDFITGMYNAGAKGYFDTIALHPYWPNAAGSIALVDAARQIMNGFGDTNASLRISEIGWSTGGTPYIYNQSEAGQANQLRALYTQLADRRAALHFRGIVWSIWSDQPSSQDWAQYTGLERSNLSAKPAYQAYKEVATGTSAGTSGSGSGSGAGAGPAGSGAASTAPATKSNAPASGGPVLAQASLSVPRSVSLRRLLRGLRLTFSCPSTCRVTIRLGLSARGARQSASRAGRLADITRTLRSGRTTVTLKLSRRVRRKLRNLHPARVFLTARLVPQAPAKPATIARRITVKP